LKLLKVMPYSPELRLNAKNQGLSLFELAPREALSQALRELGERLARRSENLAPHPHLAAPPVEQPMSSEEPFGGQRQAANDPQVLKRALHRMSSMPSRTLAATCSKARAGLAQFVLEQVGDYIARLRLAMSRYEMERLAEEIVDELTGFGPLEVLLRDPSVTEILVNGPHRVFVERAGCCSTDLRFIDAHHVQRVMQRILAPLGRRLDESSPMVDARMPDGSRVNAIIPPVALDGPCLSIRKFRQDMLKSADLLATRAIDQAIYDFLERAVGRRCNILVSGGTGTGKTTLAQHPQPDDRAPGAAGDHRGCRRAATAPPARGAPGNPSAQRRRPWRDQGQRVDSQRPAHAPRPHHPRRDPWRRSGRCDDRDEHRPRWLDEHRARQQCAGCPAAPGNPGRPDGPPGGREDLRQMICAALDVVIQLTRLADGRRCVSEVLEVVGVRDDVYVTNTLFRLDRRGGDVFLARRRTRQGPSCATRACCDRPAAAGIGAAVPGHGAAAVACGPAQAR
jgi:pilus assembly protein CpaF